MPSDGVFSLIKYVRQISVPIQRSGAPVVASTTASGARRFSAESTDGGSRPQVRTTPVVATQDAGWEGRQASYLFISVKDSGPGMSEEAQATLFQRFQQGSAKVHTEVGGTGLGLFVSAQLARLQQGRIEVR